MAVVVFDYQAFILRYPEFNAIASQTVNAVFADAASFLDNTDASVVQDVVERARLFNMLVGHMIALQMRGPTGVVGRISSASEGTVAVGTENLMPGAMAWYNQTPYGAMFAQATARFRTARYVPMQAPVRPYSYFNGLSGGFTGWN